MTLKKLQTQLFSLYKNVCQYSKKNPYLLFLLVLVVILRLPVLLDQMIPFQFDHGKDAIGSLHMWLTKSPKLIGPWTSIPGLFFGPAWYYILLPGMVLSGGSPVASVITMVLLGLITIVIAYKYFGKVTATIIATSPLFYTITTSAWNPFPMVALSLIILAVLKHIEEKKEVVPSTAAILGLSAALGFHFSTAFAIFYPLLILLSLLLKKIKLNVKSIRAGLIAFCLPFIPQALFEVKHNFIEVKAVLTYLHNGDSEPASLEKLQKVLSISWGEISQVLFPPAYFSLHQLNTLLLSILILLLGSAVFFFIKNRKKYEAYLLIDAVIWFVIPLIAFVFLHFNIWYLLPILAFTFVLMGQILDKAPKLIRNTFIAICFVVAISKIIFYITEDGANIRQNSTFLPVKEQAIEYIYQKAGDRPFASYQHLPDIYDYPYQYLYLISAKNGQKLPTDFSYKPGETAYIPEKAELLSVVSNAQDTRSPEIIFYIVEKSDNEDWLKEWWGQQQYQEIIEEHPISNKLIVYTATPVTSQ